MGHHDPSFSDAELDAQWVSILAEARVAEIAILENPPVPVPAAKTPPPRMVFSPDFLALGESPEGIESSEAPTGEAPDLEPAMVRRRPVGAR